MTISLLCCDYQIFTKVLLRRLETVMLHVMNSDRSGFIPGRQSFYNMCRLFSVLNPAHSTRQTDFAISLDAEKAFDRVEWKYLFTVLKIFGFGPSFLSWIKMLIQWLLFTPTMLPPAASSPQRGQAGLLFIPIPI